MGKRQTRPMDGFWMQRYPPFESRAVPLDDDVASAESQVKPPQPSTPTSAVDWSEVEMKGSDLRLRRYICVEALVRHGSRTVKGAASEVSSLLGNRTESDVNVCRTSYYEVRNLLLSQGLSKDEVRGDLWTFPGQFFTWRDHTRQRDDDGVEFEVGLYSKSHPAGQTRRLRELMNEIRTAPQQAESNRVWLEETVEALEKQRAIFKMGGRFLLGNLLTRASRYHRLGRHDEALPVLREALQILESEASGALPNRQDHINYVKRWIEDIEGRAY